MTSIKTKRIWDLVWDRVTSLVGVSGVDSPFSSGPLVIDEPLTLYVETWGDDNNPGTKDRPYRTIQAALDYLKPFEIDAAVTVQVGAGIFDPFEVIGLFLGSTGSLRVQGSTTVSYSGTISSIVTSGVQVVVTDTSGTFGVDSEAGKIMRALSPSSSTGEPYRVVMENSANTLTTMGSGWTTNGTQYEILTLNTQIRTLPKVSSVTVGQCFGAMVSGDGTSVSTPSGHKISVELLEFTNNNTSTRCITVSFGDVCFNGCRVLSGGQAGSLPTVLVGSNVIFSGTFFESSANNGTGVVSAFGNNGAVRLTSLRNCYLKKSVFQNGFWISVSGGMNIAACCFEGSDTAINVTRGTLINTSITAWCKNVVTGLRVAGGACSGAIFTTGTVTTAISVSDSGIFSGIFGYGITAATGVSVTKGGRCQLHAAATITSTVADINVDGATSTLAAMRANSPKIFPLTPNPYGSYVYE